MTAPTTDDELLRHFLNVRPYHTGLHLTPDQLKLGNPLAGWYFASEDAVYRFEESERRLFCHKCPDPAQNGKLYYPLLVDYQKDPLGAISHLCSTHCYHCGDGAMYPVEKLTWETKHRSIDERVKAEVEKRSREEAIRQMAVNQLAQQQQQQMPQLVGQGMGATPNHWGQQSASNQAGSYAIINRYNSPAGSSW